MNTRTLHFVVAAIMGGVLAACNGQMVNPEALPASHGWNPTRPSATKPDRPLPLEKSKSSWMLPEAKHDHLLYVSNEQTVSVYSYPRGRHVGTLEGFDRPEGECSDATGDVFITNEDTVLEFAHGGKHAIQTITMSGDQSQDCSVDPMTGNLAVTWFKDVYHGYLAVYQKATGKPKLYTHGSMVFTWCGYDDKGNLFVDGLDSSQSNDFEFAELPLSGDKLQTIALNQPISWPGAVQWDGTYMAVGDENNNVIYRFAISGSSGTEQGVVNLGSVQFLTEFWIDGKHVVGADDIPNTVWYWNYPAGGNATKSTTKGVTHPIGVTISN